MSGGGLLPTVGVVREVRAIAELHDRGSDRWVRRPGVVRTRVVPDTSVEHLRDEPPRATGNLRFVAEGEYLREFGHLLPAQQWKAVGFLVKLEVP
ncbi:MAG: hypothetical protein ACR2KG_10215 [Nocardioidaceae bacterium]